MKMKKCVQKCNEQWNVDFMECHNHKIEGKVGSSVIIIVNFRSFQLRTATF